MVLFAVACHRCQVQSLYVNMPMQYTVNFNECKNYHEFLDEKKKIYFLFLHKTLIVGTRETASAR